MNGTYLVALLFLLVLVGLRSLLRPDLLPEFLEAGFLLLLGQWSDLFSGFREVGMLAIMGLCVSSCRAMLSGWRGRVNDG